MSEEVDLTSRVRAAFNAFSEIPQDEMSRAVALMVLYTRDEAVQDAELQRIDGALQEAIFALTPFMNLMEGHLKLSFPEGDELQMSMTPAGDAHVRQLLEQQQT